MPRYKQKTPGWVWSDWPMNSSTPNCSFKRDWRWGRMNLLIWTQGSRCWPQNKVGSVMRSTRKKVRWRLNRCWRKRKSWGIRMRILRISWRLPTIRLRRWRFSMKRQRGCRPRKKWRLWRKFRRRLGRRSRASARLCLASAVDSNLPQTSLSLSKNRPFQAAMKEQTTTASPTPATIAMKAPTPTPTNHNPLPQTNPNCVRPPPSNNQCTEAKCDPTWTATSNAGAKKWKPSNKTSKKSTKTSRCSTSSAARRTPATTNKIAMKASRKRSMRSSQR